MPAVSPWLFVFVGGVVGAALRFGVDGGLHALLPDHGWWIATTLVNLSGAGILGVVRGHGLTTLPEAVRLGLTTGVLGSFTTWSAILVGMWLMIEGTSAVASAGFLLLNLVGGVVTAGVGWTIGEGLAPRRQA